MKAVTDSATGVEFELGIVQTGDPPPEFSLSNEDLSKLGKERLGPQFASWVSDDRSALMTGGCAYPDQGHLEWSSAEVNNALDLVVTLERDRKQFIVACEESPEVPVTLRLFQDSVDQIEKLSWGAHESYCVPRESYDDLVNSNSLPVFLVLRTILCGPGGFDERGRFQISPRAQYIERLKGADTLGASNQYYGETEPGRAIVNTRDEALANPRDYARLHLIVADANVMPATQLTKTFLTQLFLRAWNDGCLERFERDLYCNRDELHSDLKDISRSFSNWKLKNCAYKDQTGGVQILTSLVSILDNAYRLDFAPWESQLMRRVRFDLKVLENFPRSFDRILRMEPGKLASLREHLEWVNKAFCIRTFESQSSGKLSPDHKMALSNDFSDLNPNTGFLDQASRMAGVAEFVRVKDIDRTTLAPEGSRAHIRSQAIHFAEYNEIDVIVDWDRISVSRVANSKVNLPRPDHDYWKSPCPDGTDPGASLRLSLNEALMGKGR